MGAGHLTIMVGPGVGAFANKNCLQGRAFDHFFLNGRGMAGSLLGGRGGGDARGWN